MDSSLHRLNDEQRRTLRDSRLKLKLAIKKGKRGEKFYNSIWTREENFICNIKVFCWKAARKCKKALFADARPTPQLIAFENVLKYVFMESIKHCKYLRLMQKVERGSARKVFASKVTSIDSQNSCPAAIQEESAMTWSEDGFEQFFSDLLWNFGRLVVLTILKSFHSTEVAGSTEEPHQTSYQPLTQKQSAKPFQH